MSESDPIRSKTTDGVPEATSRLDAELTGVGNKVDEPIFVVEKERGRFPRTKPGPEHREDLRLLGHACPTTPTNRNEQVPCVLGMATSRQDGEGVFVPCLLLYGSGTTCQYCTWYKYVV